MKIKTNLLSIFTLLFIQVLMAQDKGVTGMVTDESGIPLTGVNILVQGTTTGTLTDFDGNYSINASQGDVLIFSYVGMKNQTVTVGADIVINITMLEDAAKLDEVVVTGYVSQSRKSITGAVASADVDELKKNPVVSVEQALQGKISGLNVTSTGRPRGGVRVRIRGYGSDRNNEPLYIIDGTPTEGGLNEINPDDIESISVLKDASSASIYGARAANGVVIITTKRGKKGQKAKLTYNGYSGVEFAANLPDLLNASQWAQAEWDSQLAAGLSPSSDQLGSGSSPVIPDFIFPKGAFDGDPGTTLADYNRENINGLITRSGDTDWLDELYRTAFVQNHNIGITGGGDSSTYGVSFGFLDKEGTSLYTGFKRYSMRVNTQFSLLNDKLRIGENVTIAYSESKGNQGGGFSTAYRYNPLIPVYDIAGNYAGTHGGDLGLGTNINNPVAAQFYFKDALDRTLRVFGNAYAEVDLLSGLTAKTSIGVDYINRSSRIFSPSAIERNSLANSLEESFSYETSLTWTNTLNYDKRFGEDHHLTVFAGSESIEKKARNLSGVATDFFITDPAYLTISSGGGTSTVAGNWNERTLFSLFGKLDYAFKNRYFINGTIRRDGSSALGSNNKYDIFPAFGAGWLLSDEPFMENVSFFNSLKFRGGWGEVGNQNSLGNYDFSGIFGSNPTTTNVDLNNTQNTTLEGFALLNRGNANLSWETSETLNFGMDFTLLDNHITGSLDWYNKKTKNLLTRAQLPFTSGIAAPPFINLGDIENKGWDITLGYEGQLSPDLSMGVTAIVSTYKNEVIKFGPAFRSGPSRNPPLIATRSQEGLPLSQFYGFIVDGIVQSGPNAGNFDFRDLNDDGNINQEDQTFIGDPHPDFTYSLNLNLAYKNFDFSALFRGSQGNEIYHWGKTYTDFAFRSGLNRSTRILDAWTPNNTSSNLAQYNILTADYNSQSSSYYVEDGSYLRLQTLQLGYTNRTLTGIESFRVYIQSQNVFTITKYTGIDPEVQESSAVEIGVDTDDTYPVPTSILLGLNINF